MYDIQVTLDVVERMDYQLAHDDMNEAFIIVFVEGKKMLFKLKSTAFKTFLCYRFMMSNNSSPTSKLLNETLEYLGGKAVFESNLINPDVRLIGNEEMIEIDLCDATYNAVRVTAEGFEVTQPEAYFIRRHGLLALPVPTEMTHEECLAAMVEFKGILNVTDEQYILVIGAILMSYHPSGPYPVLSVQGEHGSTKGSLCEAIKRVTDPNKTPHTTLPKDVNDLVIQAASNRVLSFDNVSEYTFNNKHSDMFSQVSTGVGLRRRKLYTDDDESVIKVTRMIMMNGIDDVVTQADLVSRSIGLRLKPVVEEARISKREFEARLTEVQPKVFSAMVKVLVCILRCHNDTHIVSGARMYDMIQWVTAGEEALGWEPGTFQRVYEQNQLEIMEISLGEDPLATAIIRFMSSRAAWSGDASRLLSCLNASTERGLRSSKAWPKSPISLGRSLTRIETSLRQLGITMNRSDRTATKRTIELVNTEQASAEIAITGGAA